MLEDSHFYVDRCMIMQQQRPSIAICICTVDRPDILRRCLDSIASAKSEPDAVLVSDDSEDGTGSKLVCDTFPGVRYIQGPRRGLCANRNALIAEARTDYIALLDDDAVVSATFISRAREIISDLAANEILTGSVLEDGRTIVAGNASFWGYFSERFEGKRRNVNLNCNVFPRSAFERSEFDENIGYGYEDMDLCSRLVSIGFDIKYDPTLVNMHMPPAKPISAQNVRLRHRQRARFYTSVKRYALWEKNISKLIAFVVLAPVHRGVHSIKDRNWRDLPFCFLDMVFALRTTMHVKNRIRESRAAL